jgi:hypothetical protein
MKLENKRSEPSLTRVTCESLDNRVLTANAHAQDFTVHPNGCCYWMCAARELVRPDVCARASLQDERKSQVGAKRDLDRDCWCREQG